MNILLIKNIKFYRTSIEDLDIKKINNFKYLLFLFFRYEPIQR